MAKSTTYSCRITKSFIHWFAYYVHVQYWHVATVDYCHTAGSDRTYVQRLQAGIAIQHSSHFAFNNYTTHVAEDCTADGTKQSRSYSYDWWYSISTKRPHHHGPPKLRLPDVHWSHSYGGNIHVVNMNNIAAVGWGTALQAGRSRVRFSMMSLEFFIDIILLAALCGRLSL